MKTTRTAHPTRQQTFQIQVAHVLTATANPALLALSGAYDGGLIYEGGMRLVGEIEGSSVRWLAGYVAESSTRQPHSYT